TEMICRIMGVPYSMNSTLGRWVVDLVNGHLPMATEEDVRVADQAAAEALEYFGALAEQRQVDPGDDVFSGLALAEEQGDRLSKTELFTLAMELTGAGDETTANMIADRMMLVLQNPDQPELVEADPALVRAAIEECLRLEPSFRFGHHFVATPDVALGGKVIPKGAKVSVWLAAANRDPAVFEDPDRFDVTREPHTTSALSLGALLCTGSGRARIEISVAVPPLLTLPGLERASNDLRWRTDWYPVRALESLPIRWNA